MTLRETAGRLLAVLFPPRCVICDRVVEYDTPHCGCPLKEPDTPLLRLGCLAAVSAFDYSGAARDAVLRYKAAPDIRAARFLADKMLEAWESSRYLATRCSLSTVNCIVPVPPKQMELAAGPDHARYLADHIAARLELPVCGDALLRRDDSRAQHSLDRAARAENARRSYFAAEDFPLAGKRVLLVDDILTTGATLTACAAALLNAGAAETAALTVCRTRLEADGNV